MLEYSTGRLEAGVESKCGHCRASGETTWEERNTDAFGRVLTNIVVSVPGA